MNPVPEVMDMYVVGCLCLCLLFFRCFIFSAFVSFRRQSDCVYIYEQRVRKKGEDEMKISKNKNEEREREREREKKKKEEWRMIEL